MNRMPGWGIVKGMAFSIRRAFLERKVTVQYPEVVQDISPRHRGRLLLLYDEYGALKCETCFQCAAACPIECIDMGGVDTKNRFHVHWGPAEQYAERREESALRRSGRPVPDRVFEAWQPIDLSSLDRILMEEEYSPRRLLRILERTQDTYGHLPVAALQHISHATSAWYSEIYGIATSYGHLRFEPPTGHVIGACRCAMCAMRGGGRIHESLEAALGTGVGGVSPDGAVRFEAADCGGEPDRQPYVTLDGAALAGMTPERATELAASLRAGVPQGRPA